VHSGLHGSEDHTLQHFVAKQFGAAQAHLAILDRQGCQNGLDLRLFGIHNGNLSDMAEMPSAYCLVHPINHAADILISTLLQPRSRHNQIPVAETVRSLKQGKKRKIALLGGDCVHRFAKLVR
jgi:hypothetical protein